MPRVPLALVGLATVLLVSTARAQAELYTFEGHAPHDVFGRIDTAGGDVDGDGLSDILIGARQFDNTAGVFVGPGLPSSLVGLTANHAVAVVDLFGPVGVSVPAPLLLID